MGQGMSHEHGLFSAVQSGDVESVKAVLERDPTVLHTTTLYHRQSALRIAGASGHIQILSMLLERSLKPDVLNRNKQTSLMLAAMHGKISCVKKLLEADANEEEPAYTMQPITATGNASVPLGYARFVNIRDGGGATPLHLAARQRRPQCVHILLHNGGLVCASTAIYGTPLHLAARGGSVDRIRQLLAWGADRLQRDASGRIPYMVAKVGACAALLDPSSAEPLVWPSPLKFISELNQDAKGLSEQALIDANTAREKTVLKGTAYSPAHSDDEEEMCCICFERVCSIQVGECGHQM